MLSTTWVYSMPRTPLYKTRTHHSNADVLDRLQADDLKQLAVLMAPFACQAAMHDTKVPRKPERKSN
jgi:hypothetical protein